MKGVKLASHILGPTEGRTNDQIRGSDRREVIPHQEIWTRKINREKQHFEIDRDKKERKISTQKHDSKYQKEIEERNVRKIQELNRI